MLTTQKEVRSAFWEVHQEFHGVSKKKIPDHSGQGKIYDTDTRCAFSDFVDPPATVW